ncbi:hypothetical protein [Maribellus sediminis]|uniref:hypothetical protein n=1 Tax=Maribellus sediminis TaxID=2696285 RepID=UPI0014318E8F|nr:hypothetical protein [Maribellus sediminis]
MKTKNEISSLRIVGGMTAVGFLVGLFFLHISVQILLASVIIGIGIGLVLSPVFPSNN